MSYSNKWTQEIRQTLSQVLSESKRPTKENENMLKRAKEKDEAEKKRWKDSIKGSGPKKYDEKGMDYALGVHGKYTYDHVEHEGNNLQEEMALNEDLLMLIDVLCEELGIDVDELMEVTAFNDSQRIKNPEIQSMERHQLGRLRNLADRVNRGKARLNNPTTAGDRLAALMRARGSNAMSSRDGSGVFADETNTGGNYYPVKQDTKLSTSHLSGNERLGAAEVANDMRIRDRKKSRAQLVRKKSDQKWGAPEGID